MCLGFLEDEELLHVVEWMSEGYSTIGSLSQQDKIEQLEDMMKLFDSDKDGRLNISEFSHLYDKTVQKRKEHRNDLSLSANIRPTRELIVRISTLCSFFRVAHILLILDSL